jgi:hypothetical protein
MSEGDRKKRDEQRTRVVIVVVTSEVLSNLLEGDVG